MLISGGGQAGKAGSASAQPLVVELRNAAGNPIVGRTVNWSDQTSATQVNAATSVTDGSGRASMGFTYFQGPAAIAGASERFAPPFRRLPVHNRLGYRARFRRPAPCVGSQPKRAGWIRRRPHHRGTARLDRNDFRRGSNRDLVRALEFGPGHAQRNQHSHRCKWQGHHRFPVRAAWDRRNHCAYRAPEVDMRFVSVGSDQMTLVSVQTLDGSPRVRRRCRSRSKCAM